MKRTSVNPAFHLFFHQTRRSPSVCWSSTAGTCSTRSACPCPAWALLRSPAASAVLSTAAPWVPFWRWRNSSFSATLFTTLLKTFFCNKQQKHLLAPVLLQAVYRFMSCWKKISRLLLSTRAFSLQMIKMVRFCPSMALKHLASRSVVHHLLVWLILYLGVET